MKQATDIGMNRTGMGTSPDSKRMMDNTQIPVPTYTVPGEAKASQPTVGTMAGFLANVNELGKLRGTYIENALPVGTVPAPVAVKAMPAAVVEMLKGKKGTFLLDKLAERLAFERTQARLYGLMVNKLRMAGGQGTEKVINMFQRFQEEEINHFNTLWGVMESLGVDPTVVSPMADINGLTTQGLFQTVVDPRTTPLQCLCAVQLAELVDNDGWTSLIDVVHTLNHKELVEDFRKLAREEEQHLAQVRGVVQEFVHKELG